jgi:transcriptional regulator with GAF, ATPase, and Fis domain
MTDSNLQLENKVIPIKIQSQIIFRDIVGHGPAMQKIFKIVEKVADSDTTIMLNGETGTGKGLIARAIHFASGRNEKPFVQINCGATPEGLLESEFFGYRRGAFTGATASRSTAAPHRRVCWKANFSVTGAELLPVPPQIRPANLKWPKAALFF